MSYGNETMLTMPVQPAYGNGNSGWGFGGDGAWWIIILFLFCFNGGMWGNGWNGGGMNGGVGSEVQRGFDHSATIQKLDGITNGLCDGFYATQNAINSGFNTTQMAIMQGNNAIQGQLAECCCATQRAIDGVNYNLATQSCDTRNTIQNATRDILENNNSNTRAILDFLTQDKIATLTAENQNLKLAASQANQNAYLTATIDAGNAELIRRLGRDVPVPAYVVPNPNCCYGNYGLNYSGCGCA